ncbi:MAG: cupin domain-containing protein [Opitutaceae bacterium]|nr:cupin domain-containing protein [Opitutaceae bacterium]
MPPTAAQLIAHLHLAPLPGEGGYFRQTSCRPAASAIVFLLTPRDFSALHRIAQDEVWHFYAGDPVEHVQFVADGSVAVARMGSQVLAGEQPQVLVPAGIWQGARLAPAPAGGAGYALLGCTVSPPWYERGFELGARAELLAGFPAHAGWVHALTR